MMHTSRTLGRAPSLHSVGGWIGSTLHRLRASARAKQASAALLTMPDHILRDIGVLHLESLIPSAREQSSWGNRW